MPQQELPAQGGWRPILYIVIAYALDRCAQQARLWGIHGVLSGGWLFQAGCSHWLEWGTWITTHHEACHAEAVAVTTADRQSMVTEGACLSFTTLL